MQLTVISNVCTFEADTLTRQAAFRLQPIAPQALKFLLEESNGADVNVDEQCLGFPPYSVVDARRGRPIFEQASVNPFVPQDRRMFAITTGSLASSRFSGENSVCNIGHERSSIWGCMLYVLDRRLCYNIGHFTMQLSSGAARFTW